MHRRQFLRTCALTGTSLALSSPQRTACAAEAAAPDLVQSIEQVIIRRREQDPHSWFSARGCMVPGPAGAKDLSQNSPSRVARPGRTELPTGYGTGSKALITLQTIHGSDFFGPVQWIESADLGKTWSEPQPIPALGRRRISDEIEEGVCDVVPEYHAPTRSVLAMGHNVFYKPKGFYKPQPPRWPVYAVRDPQGRWSEARRLKWDDSRTTAMYSCGCAQRITLDNGQLLIPLTFGPLERADRGVTSVRATFDGSEVRIQEVGNELRLPVQRGLLEPSLARLDGRYYMTIRAEDERGYATTSQDGLHWEPITPWCWDDGEPLVMSTTQQRWLPHSDGLYLVYTRKAEQNAKVMRWRAPLYMALVDRTRLRLIRASERIAMPMQGDPNQPKTVPHLGNFHTMPVNAQQSWVTVGAFDLATWHGNLQMARITWSQPNRLAP